MTHQFPSIISFLFYAMKGFYQNDIFRVPIQLYFCGFHFNQFQFFSPNKISTIFSLFNKNYLGWDTISYPIQ